MSQVRLTPQIPRKRLMMLEARAALDYSRMWGPLLRASVQRSNKKSDSLVIVVPGFGSGDRYTLPMRRYLNARGLKAEGWGLGTNRAGTNLPHTQDDLSDRWQFVKREQYNGEAGVPYLIDQFFERVLKRHRETKRSVSLVGWSLGGYVAREVARDMPEIVDRVVTMGSPVVGGPKYTAVAPFFDRGGQDLDWIEDEIQRRESTRIQQPITAIYSKTDGIVGWQAAIDQYSPNVQHVEVNAAHLGMGFNASIWQTVENALHSCAH
ncbi:MAG: alpha/beta hydrolase [Pseudomonadota bacterium]